MECTSIQDLLPDLVAERLGPDRRAEVEEHLEGCHSCSDLRGTLEVLAHGRPPVPEGLEDRIQVAARAALAQRMRPSASAPTGLRAWLHRSPAWGLAAAAVLALVVGVPLVLPDGDEAGSRFLAMAEEEVGSFWLGDDAMVAGAPALSDLSDEALEELLEEMGR